MKLTKAGTICWSDVNEKVSKSISSSLLADFFYFVSIFFYFKRKINSEILLFAFNHTSLSK